jgi:hypothetical protein
MNNVEMHGVRLMRHAPYNTGEYLRYFSRINKNTDGLTRPCFFVFSHYFNEPKDLGGTEN